ncbi:MAG: hypothetical protein ACI4MQ_00225 [Candidatus Coproplasma sp.]
MIAWVLSVIFILFLVSAVALIHRRESAKEIFKHIRKMTKCVLSFAVICIVGVIVLTSAFSYTSDYLKSVLSVEFMDEVREVLRELFGTESVFTSLQMLGALSIFLFSFASCAFCICGVCIFLMRTSSQKENGVEEFEENDVDLPYGICVRRFALLSRYLL